jgi:glycosyltransferase involved in cell wall biosynthesis
MERLTLYFGDKIITPTKIWEKRYLNFKIKKNKIKIIMNLPDKRIFKTNYKIRKYQKFKIIYHGTVTLRYGVDILLESVKLIEEKIPKLKLYIIGDGDLVSYLLELTKKLSLEGKVYFSKKFVDVETLPKILQHMDVGVVPNRNDNFTSQVLNAKLLEYLVMGIPVIASKTFTLRKYFKKGEILFFTPESPDELGEKILLIYKNKRLRETLVTNGKKFFGKYNWEKEGEELYQFTCK